MNYGNYACDFNSPKINRFISILFDKISRIYRLLRIQICSVSADYYPYCFFDTPPVSILLFKNRRGR